MPAPRRPASRATTRTRRPSTRTDLGAAQTPKPVPPTAAEVSHRRAGLTTRAAVLGLIVCALVVSLALPLRTYLWQRSQISQAEAAQQDQKARVAVLAAENQQLADPAYIAAEARRRLHFVKPGETAYVLIEPTPNPTPSGPSKTGGAMTTGVEAPWYSQLYGSVRAADGEAK